MSSIIRMDEFREKYEGIAKDAARISALDKTAEEFKAKKEKVRRLFDQFKRGESLLAKTIISSMAEIILPELDSIELMVNRELRPLDAKKLATICINKEKHEELHCPIHEIREILSKVSTKIKNYSVSDEELKTVKEEASDCKKRLEEVATSLALSTIRADLEIVSSSDLTQLSSEDKQMIETISSLRECEGVSGFLATEHPSLQIKTKKQVQFSEEPATVSYFEYEKSPVVVTREEQNRPRNARPVPPRSNRVFWSASQFGANLSAMLFSALELEDSGLTEADPK